MTGLNGWLVTLVAFAVSVVVAVLVGLLFLWASSDPATEFKAVLWAIPVAVVLMGTAAGVVIDLLRHAKKRATGAPS